MSGPRDLMPHPAGNAVCISIFIAAFILQLAAKCFELGPKTSSNHHDEDAMPMGSCLLNVWAHNSGICSLYFMQCQSVGKVAHRDSCYAWDGLILMCEGPAWFALTGRPRGPIVERVSTTFLYRWCLSDDHTCNRPVSAGDGGQAEVTLRYSATCFKRIFACCVRAELLEYVTLCVKPCLSLMDGFVNQHLDL